MFATAPIDASVFMIMLATQPANAPMIIQEIIPIVATPLLLEFKSYHIFLLVKPSELKKAKS